ncbi:MAG: hypothetical protein PUP93_29050 [Rhizonema sp. NSF051]|nr:hypothetical protein [Rhizonema sp. NSF051]
MANPNPSPATRYKNAGIVLKHNQPPISVKMPEPYDSILRLMDNRSEFIRKAVVNQLKIESYI